ncbi:hypothetical protein [Burkholderia ubonensis]|nr:hypothetical protein [Burkholderia ubonensis]
MKRYALQSLLALSVSLAIGAIIAVNPTHVSQAQSNKTAAAIQISSSVPSELNPPFNDKGGGAPTATPEQAAAFAWQEFIALNWPAGPQEGKIGQRDAPSSKYRFGDPSYTGPLVWETFRSKVEIFPGNFQFKSGMPTYGPPPGYPGVKDPSLGYDALPAYNYGTSIQACRPSQQRNSTPWINLDETDQITLANMFAGVVDSTQASGNSAPQLIRFLAKANRSEYVYVAGNSDPNDSSKQWWASIPSNVVTDTKNYLAKYKTSPPNNGTKGSKTYVSLPDGTIEIKAGWRQLSADEIKSGRFHMQLVRFYEKVGTTGTKCFRDAMWGLVALHIIQKTPSAPYFIYATFEQADNLLTSDGKPVEDADGQVIGSPAATATTPQVCLVDPQPASQPQGQEIPSNLGSVILTSDPDRCRPLTNASYCKAPGKQLYYRNEQSMNPSGGYICVNKRDNAIPDYVVKANMQAHAAIADHLKQAGIPTSPWMAYKLINVQYFPYDKNPDRNKPNGSPYTPASAPYSASNPAASSYYMANIVVETNRSLQMFSGGLSPNVSTDWNQDGSKHKNTYYGGVFHNMGGCMGCHGSQGQNPAGQAGDFSVILARGTVSSPEAPAAETAGGLASALRNRSLK